MFLTLLLVTFILALVVSAIVAIAFSKPINNILKRIVDDAISIAWLQYLKFAIIVVGVSAACVSMSLKYTLRRINGRKMQKFSH
jgi:archaellum component FlaG (FlaF/FlaG flagellin family)